MRSVLIFISIVLFAIPAFCHGPVNETFIRQFWLNPYIYNPSAGSIFTKREATAIYSYEPTFTNGSFIANYTHAFKERHVLGFNSGMSGYKTNTYRNAQKFLSISYSYIIDIKNDAELRVGFAPKFIDQQFIKNNPGELFILPRHSKIFTFDAGAVFKSKNFYAGYSVINIIDKNIREPGKTSSIQPISHFIACYKIPIHKNIIAIQPTLGIEGTLLTYEYLVNIGGSVILFDALTIGSAYSTNLLFSGSDGVTGNFAVTLKRFTLGLSSDVYFADNSMEKGAEAILKYSF